MAGVTGGEGRVRWGADAGARSVVVVSALASPFILTPIVGRNILFPPPFLPLSTVFLPSDSTTAAKELLEQFRQRSPFIAEKNRRTFSACWRTCLPTIGPVRLGATSRHLEIERVILKKIKFRTKTGKVKSDNKLDYGTFENFTSFKNNKASG